MGKLSRTTAVHGVSLKTKWPQALMFTVDQFLTATGPYQERNCVKSRERKRQKEKVSEMGRATVR